MAILSLKKRSGEFMSSNELAMKTVGIIAEYNPFHNGHAYHIKKSKEITGADCAVVIMSGKR